MLQVYSLKMNRELNETERQLALDILTPKRKAKALRFRRFKDQNHSIMTGLLEAYAIRSKLGILESVYANDCSNDCLNNCVNNCESNSENGYESGYEIDYGSEGKPFIKNHPEINYNISHAGDYVVCCIGNQPVGIDVEEESRYTESVVKRFFQPSETEDIMSKESIEERRECFAKYWVMKESFMKLSGAGFAVPLKSFCCDRYSGEIQLGEKIPEKWLQVLYGMGMNEEKKPICQFVTLETGYQCAICTIDKVQVQYEMLEWETLISSLRRSE